MWTLGGLYFTIHREGSVPESSTAELRKRINVALNCLPAMSSDMARHHLWVIRGVMHDIDPERDISAAELLTLLAVLAPVHARVLTRRAAADVTSPRKDVGGAPALRVIRDTTSDLA